MQPHIFIAVPSYGGWMRNPTAWSLLQLSAALAAAKIETSGRYYEFGDIAAVRNFFGSLMLQEPKFTHLLFSDNDMGYTPSTVFKLIAADKPMIGAIYAKRDFPVRPVIPVGQELKPTDKVDRIGMGLTLIATDVFRKLATIGKLRTQATHPHVRAGLTQPLFGFFDRIIKDDGGEISEDFSFCDRWRELCSGEIWALSGEKIRHWGDVAYELPYDAA